VTADCRSTFALDVYWSSHGSGAGDADASLAAHLETCGRCRDYLARLDALDANRPPLRIAPSDSPASPAPTPTRLRWVVPLAGALALAAATALLLRTRPPADGRDAYVGLKGTPAVQLLLHRDRDTQIWDGRSPLRPGDALALRVACEGMSHVAVAAPGSDARWERLSDAACADGDAPLPFTLRVDDAPGDEKLAVVLSREDLDEPALRKAIAETQRTADVWVVSLLLPKELPKELEKNR
jgi:hypothetical protein